MTHHPLPQLAEHDHRDPRRVPPGIRFAIANVVPRRAWAAHRGAPRLDQVVNWGRKAAHPRA